MMVNSKGEDEEIEVINSFIDDADREVDWAVDSLARALERKQKAGVLERMKTAILEAMGMQTERTNSATGRDADMADEKQLSELSAKIDGLPASIAEAITKGIGEAVGVAVGNAVKPLVDAQNQSIANQKAKDDAETERLVGLVVKANLLDEETAKATPLNTLRKLSESNKLGTAAPLNSAAAKLGSDKPGFKPPKAEG